MAAGHQLEAAGLGAAPERPTGRSPDPELLSCALEPRCAVCGGAGDAGPGLQGEARPRRAGVGATPRQRRAGPSLFEALSHRPVRDRTTSAEAAPAASERAPRRRVSGGAAGPRDAEGAR